MLSLRLSTRRQFSTSLVKFAGHNKWSKIKQKKGINDASKSAIYSKATQDILVAARSGGTDPETNSALAIVLKRLKSQGVPKDNIAKALAKAAKVKSSGPPSIYEAIACGSVGIIIECVTDNTNRTVKSLREIMSPRNARLAPVKFMFRETATITIGVDKQPDMYDRLDALAEMALCLDEGVEDFEILTDESHSRMRFYLVQSALSDVTSFFEQEPDVTILGTELSFDPVDKTAHLLSEEDTKAVEELLDTLREHDDVVRITTT